MPQHTTPRLPLSCENCRKRKIKCGTTGQVPCTTCVRRGHAQSCNYKRGAEAAAPATTDESELLYRIRNLEDLLKQQIAQSTQSPPGHRSASSPTSSAQASPYTVADVRSVRSRSQLCGIIITSPAGYQYFSRRASTFDTILVHELVETTPSPMCTIGFPFGPEPLGTRSTLLDILPPLRHCDELKSLFFDVFSPLFHVLHDPTFDAMYNSFRQDPSNVPLSWLGLLFVVLSIAVTALDEDSPLLRDLGRESSATMNIKKLSSRYRSASMQCLAADQFLHQHNLQTVQTLILLIYAMNHANISSWAILGMTWNIAVRIGCHIDPSRLGLRAVEGEERRRCWAALMMLYTIQNTCLGNIAPQNIIAEVDIPVDKEDEDISDDQFPIEEVIQRERGPSKMSYILYKFRLYEVAAEICQFALEEQLSDPKIIFALDQKLAAQEQEHNTRFSGQNLPLYHIVHHYILRSYTHHLYLILHRTSLNAQGVAQDVALQSRQRCKLSATVILEIHDHLYNTAEFRPYQWYVYGLGSFHAFLAVSVLILLLSYTTHNDNDNSDHPRMRALIEKCFQRFELMAHRSDICARAASILRGVLQNSSQAVPTIELGTVRGPSLQNGSARQYPISPTSEPEQYIASAYDWSLNPELEAILVDMAPQQWMAPTSFNWDRWNYVALV